MRGPSSSDSIRNIRRNDGPLRQAAFYRKNRLKLGTRGLPLVGDSTDQSRSDAALKQLGSQAARWGSEGSYLTARKAFYNTLPRGEGL